AVLRANGRVERRRGGIEDFVPKLVRSLLARLSQPGDERSHASLRDKSHPGALVGRQLTKPRQHVVHPGHAGGGKGTGGAFDRSNALLDTLGAHPLSLAQIHEHGIGTACAVRRLVSGSGPTSAAGTALVA